MEIIEKLLKINPFSRSGEKQNKIEYIIIHWVGNANTSAIANRNYFENLSKTQLTYASSQYIIGLEGEIIKCVPDDEVAFHSGSYSMNRKSIGIEVCHPDWEGKFNEKTYNNLIELCIELCRKYNINANNIKRHYDITGKNCPRYYVQNEDEWIKFKNDVANKLGQGIIPETKGSDEPVRKYKNGSTKEIIFADSNLTKIIGSLAPYEECDCLGLFNERPIVRYKVTGTNNYKIGFAKWKDGIK